MAGTLARQVWQVWHVEAIRPGVYPAADWLQPGPKFGSARPTAGGIISRAPLNRAWANTGCELVMGEKTHVNTTDLAATRRWCKSRQGVPHSKTPTLTAAPAPGAATNDSETGRMRTAARTEPKMPETKRIPRQLVDHHVGPALSRKGAPASLRRSVFGLVRPGPSAFLPPDRTWQIWD
jgi:hypothetical protein